jgi:hypothetical protein
MNRGYGDEEPTVVMRDEYATVRRSELAGLAAGRYAWVIWATCDMCGERFPTDRAFAHKRFMAGVPVSQCRFCHPGGHVDAPEPRID